MENECAVRAAVILIESLREPARVGRSGVDDMKKFKLRTTNDEFVLLIFKGTAVRYAIRNS